MTECGSNGVAPHWRILAVADLWQGSDAYAYVRAFRRLGHSVRVLAPENYVPSAWSAKPLRAVRRLLEPALVGEYASALVAEARLLRPHLLFVFKGRYVHPEAIRRIQALGVPCVNVFPDVSFMSHGSYLPRSLPRYDWVFTTKSYGLGDLERLLGVRRASFLQPSFDPEVHVPVTLDEEEQDYYGCDVSFIGTWSPKKQALLERVRAALPAIDLRIWGAQWAPARRTLGSAIQGHGVLGLEFAKAIVASKINLGILSEARKGASSQDLITTRTFHIPATGAFMLHERTAEFLKYFEEDRECACFADAGELVEKANDYLAHPERRQAAAAGGLRRSLDAGYSVDRQARRVLEKVAELRAAVT